MTDTTDPRVLAAVRAAHFERWQRLYGRGPILAPRRYAQLMPEPVLAVPSLLEADAQGRHTRSAVRALARSRSPVTQQLVQGFSDQVAQSYNGGPRQCRCEVASWLLDRQGGQPQAADALSAAADDVVSSRRPLASPVLRHAAQLDFDPATWVSTATELVIFESSRTAALSVIEGAFPQNWARGGKDASDFFKQTVWVDPNAPGVPLKEPLDPRRGYLLEEAAWQWNRDYDGGSRVILEVKPLAVVRESERHDNRPEQAQAPFFDATDPADPVVKLHFKYRLHQCLSTRLVIASSAGGIGVDEGETYIEWLEEQRQLRVFASKRVRFDGTRELDAEAVALLNMTAPATISMLMQRLALDAPLDAIRALPDPEPRVQAAAS